MINRRGFLLSPLAAIRVPPPPVTLIGHLTLAARPGEGYFAIGQHAALMVKTDDTATIRALEAICDRDVTVTVTG